MRIIQRIVCTLGLAGMAFSAQAAPRWSPAPTRPLGFLEGGFTPREQALLQRALFFKDDASPCLSATTGCRYAVVEPHVRSVATETNRELHDAMNVVFREAVSFTERPMLHAYFMQVEATAFLQRMQARTADRGQRARLERLVDQARANEKALLSFVSRAPSEEMRTAAVGEMFRTMRRVHAIPDELSLEDFALGWPEHAASLYRQVAAVVKIGIGLPPSPALSRVLDSSRARNERLEFWPPSVKAVQPSSGSPLVASTGDAFASYRIISLPEGAEMDIELGFFGAREALSSASGDWYPGVDLAGELEVAGEPLNIAQIRSPVCLKQVGTAEAISFTACESEEAP